MRDKKVKNLVITAFLAALVYLMTNINIRLPFSITGGGLVHLGMAMCLFSAFTFGKEIGAFSGAIGMTLFDILSDYFLWAPFTFIISLTIGYISGLIAFKKDSSLNFILYIIASIFAVVIKVSGYYITEVILYHNIISPISSIPGNIVQVLVGSIIAIPLTVLVKKHPSFKQVQNI